MKGKTEYIKPEIELVILPETCSFRAEAWSVNKGKGPKTASTEEININDGSGTVDEEDVLSNSFEGGFDSDFYHDWNFE